MTGLIIADALMLLLTVASFALSTRAHRRDVRMRRKLAARVGELEARLSGLPSPSELRLALEAAEGAATKAQVQGLLDRAGAERIVGQVNALSARFETLNDFVESLKTQHGLRVALFGEEPELAQRRTPEPSIQE